MVSSVPFACAIAPQPIGGQPKEGLSPSCHFADKGGSVPFLPSTAKENAEETFPRRQVRLDIAVELCLRCLLNSDFCVIGNPLVRLEALGGLAQDEVLSLVFYLLPNLAWGWRWVPSCGTPRRYHPRTIQGSHGGRPHQARYPERPSRAFVSMSIMFICCSPPFWLT